MVAFHASDMSEIRVQFRAWRMGWLDVEFEAAFDIV